jgi:sterol desaturase/sphingolipid hydroxylase (fatty acid hydroxylase superfamily)
MELNYGAIAVATIVQFVVGAVWYTPLFGKLWGKIHGFDKLSTAEQKVAQKQMMPLLLVQFGLTVVTSFVLALLLAGMPAGWNAYGFAGFIWLGFVMPAQVSAVIFGGTEPKWVMKKIGVSVGASLLCYLSAAAVFVLMH